MGCLLCALSFGYFINTIDFDGPEDNKQIRLLVGLLGHVASAGLAFHFHKRLSKLPSWIWAAVLGSLLRILFLDLIFLCSYSDYGKRVASWSSFCSFAKFLIAGTIGNWIFWAVGALVCIFAVRLVAFFVPRLFGQIRSSDM